MIPLIYADKIGTQKREHEHTKDKGYQLGHLILSNGVVKRMKMLAKRSEDIHKEIGFNLCADKHDHNILITTGMTCVGSECEMTTQLEKRQECPPGKFRVGDFHTHPDSKTADMSHVDMRILYELGIGCIGTTKEINCFTRKGHYDKDMEQHLRYLVNKIEKEQYQMRIIGENNKNKQKFFKDNFEEVTI